MNRVHMYLWVESCDVEGSVVFCDVIIRSADIITESVCSVDSVYTSSSSLPDVSLMYTLLNILLTN